MIQQPCMGMKLTMSLKHLTYPRRVKTILLARSRRIKLVALSRDRKIARIAWFNAYNNKGKSQISVNFDIVKPWENVNPEY